MNKNCLIFLSMLTVKEKPKSTFLKYTIRKYLLKMYSLYKMHTFTYKKLFNSKKSNLISYVAS